MDRNKVIKGLLIERECVSRDCDRDCGKCDLVQDRDWLLSVYDEAIALLKEQEAVKRTYRTGINGFSIIWTCGACGSDLYPNNAKAKYCSNCGQAVKWE